MPKILGIVNLTPDSFYAPSRTDPGQICDVVRKMLDDGAWAVDLGAVSTRPGSSPVPLEEEWERLSPALGALAREMPGVRVSIDTFNSEIVRRAFDVIGPFAVNDISAGQMDPEMLPLTGRLGLPYIAMHMHGSPVAPSPTHGDVVEDVIRYFREFTLKAADAGISEWYLDPGFGFSKSVEQNWEVLHRLSELQCIGRPILVGISRKSMIWKRYGITPSEALPATRDAHVLALKQGAEVLRVHDVADAANTIRQLYPNEF